MRPFAVIFIPLRKTSRVHFPQYILYSTCDILNLFNSFKVFLFILILLRKVELAHKAFLNEINGIKMPLTKKIVCVYMYNICSCFISKQLQIVVKTTNSHGFIFAFMVFIQIIVDEFLFIYLG